MSKAGLSEEQIQVMEAIAEIVKGSAKQRDTLSNIRIAGDGSPFHAGHYSLAVNNRIILTFNGNFECKGDAQYVSDAWNQAENLADYVKSLAAELQKVNRMVEIATGIMYCDGCDGAGECGDACTEWLRSKAEEVQPR